MADAGHYHRILDRQLRRLGLCPTSAPSGTAWSQFLDVVSVSYREADDDRYTLERSIEISSEEMLALHDVLSRRAHEDVLTGLPNRYALREFLDNAIARRGAGDVAVLFIDLDEFKLVNDNLGHSAGDALLVLAAKRICGAVRERDLVARLGGDEFVVACVDVDIDTAMLLAERIAAGLEPSFRVGAMESTITSSVGIAIAGPGDTTTDDFLRMADLAMYDAKARGRCQVAVFDDEMRQKVERRLSIENALRHAVDHGELALYYQPIVRLSDQRPVGVESLVRWHRPGHGLLMPSAFIPIAEATRLITLIDSWVIRTACQQAAAWSWAELSIAVNLSARDLQQSEIVSEVRTALDSAGLPPHQLTVEITETTLVSGDAAIAANLARLRALGVSLAIDDFGVGYSSFSSLRDLPAHILKIDRSLVSTVDKDDSSAVIVGAIIGMGHALGLKVVAEGVERPDQADRLLDLGCDAAQGYLFGQPRTAGEISRYLVDHREPEPVRFASAPVRRDWNAHAVTEDRGAAPGSEAG